METVQGEVNAAQTKARSSSLEISEGLLRRDNYFHKCWMRLKHLRPDIMEDMSKVELYMAGYDDASENEEETGDGSRVL